MILLRMNKTVGFTAIFMLLCVHAFPGMVRGQNAFCNTRNTSFQEGEKLNFKVYYNMSFIWIFAGNASFTTTLSEMNGNKVYHVVGAGKTASSYEWFYKVNDKYETFINTETMIPERFIRDVNEGSMRFHHDVTFYHKKEQAVSKNKTYTITKCTQDVLSAIFFARNIDYSKYNVGDKIPFDMFLDDKLYSLYIKYQGKEVIETKMGKFRAIKIVPLLIEGTIFDGGEKMVVWVSDDANHLPLRVDSPILVGSIKVDLMGYENLRNPFSSLISRN
jgi:hypothetical protein